MVYSGFEPGTTAWQAQTNPLSWYDCPISRAKLCFRMKQELVMGIDSLTGSLNPSIGH